MRVDHAAGADDFLGRDDRLDVERRLARGHGFENGAFLGAVRIADDDLHHEAVHLRFGQRIGALLLQRILRGEHQKRIGQFVRSRRRW